VQPDDNRPGARRAACAAPAASRPIACASSGCGSTCACARSSVGRSIRSSESVRLPVSPHSLP